jgi:ribosomal protein L22
MLQTKKIEQQAKTIRSMKFESAMACLQTMIIHVESAQLWRNSYFASRNAFMEKAKEKELKEGENPTGIDQT